MSKPKAVLPEGYVQGRAVVKRGTKIRYVLETELPIKDGDCLPFVCECGKDLDQTARMSERWEFPDSRTRLANGEITYVCECGAVTVLVCKGWAI